MLRRLFRHPWGLDSMSRQARTQALRQLPARRRLLNRLYLGLVPPLRPLFGKLVDLMGIPRSSLILTTATGNCLDSIAISAFNLKRNPGETDADFRARIVEYIRAYPASKS
jgi:hypothetical protein